MVWLIIICLLVFGGMCIIYSYFYLLFDMLGIKRKLYYFLKRCDIKWKRYTYNKRRRKHEKRN